jgi:hypothetical protein
MGVLGFSFGFGARDAGLSSAFANTTRSLRGIGGEVAKLGGIAKGVDMGAMFAGFGTAALSKISGDLEKITGGNENLVNSLESTMAEYNKQARIIGAQSGYTGAALDKFAGSVASLSYSMKLAPDSVAKAQKSFMSLSDDFRGELEANGYGLKQFLKAQEATGIDSGVLIKQMDSLNSTFGFTAEESLDFLDSFTAVARGSGMAGDAFGKFTESIDNVSNSMATNLAGLAMTADEQKKYIKDQIIGQQKLAGALSKSGAVQSDKAMAAAEAFGKALADGQKGLSDMMSGMDGATTDLFNQIAQQAGGVDFATMIIGQTPDVAMANLIDIRNRLAKEGDKGLTALNRLDNEMSKISPDLIFRSLGSPELQKKFLDNMTELQGAADDSTDAFRKFGNETYRSLILAPEQIDRAKQALEAKLARIGGGVQEFTNFQVKAFGDIGNAVEKLSKDETWGPLMKRFALATREGVGAFFMPMLQQGRALENQLKALGDIKTMGPLRGRLEAIRQLGVAGIFYDMSKGVRDTQGAMNDAQERTSALYSKLLLLRKGFDAFLPVVIALGGALGALFGLTKVFGVFTDAIKGIIGPIYGVISAMAAFTAAVIGWPATILLGIVGFIAIWNALPDKVKDKLDELLGVASTWIGKFADKLADIDGKAIGDKIAAALKSAVDTIKTFLSGEELTKEASGFEKFVFAMARVLKESWTILRDALKVVLDLMMKDPDVVKYFTIPLAFAVAGPAVAEVIAAAVGALGAGIMAALGAMATKSLTAWLAGPAAAALLTGLQGALMAAVTSIGGFITGTLAPILGVLLLLFGPLMAGYLGKGTRDAIDGALTNISTFLTNFSTNLLNWARNLGPMFGKAISGLGNAFSLDWIPSGTEIVEKTTEGMKYLVTELGPKIIATVRSLDLSGAAIAFVDSMFSASNVENATGGIDWKGLLGSLVGFLYSAFVGFFGMVGFAGELLFALGALLADVLGAAVIALVGVVVNMLVEAGKWLIKSIGNAIADIASAIRGLVRLIPGLDGTKWSWIDNLKDWGTVSDAEAAKVTADQAAVAKQFGEKIGKASNEGMSAGIQASVDSHKKDGMLTGWFGPEAMAKQDAEAKAFIQGNMDKASAYMDESLMSFLQEQSGMGKKEFAKFAKDNAALIAQAGDAQIAAAATSGVAFNGKMGKIMLSMAASEILAKQQVAKLWADGGMKNSLAISNIMQNNPTADKSRLGLLYDPSGAYQDTGSGIVDSTKNFLTNMAGGASDVLAGAPDFFGAGVKVMDATAEGITVGAASAKNAVVESQSQVRALMPSRGVPIPANLPLADVVDAGAEIMFRIAQGMITGTAYMQNAMMNAYLALQDEMEIGNINLSAVMTASFDTMGRSVSAVFADAVISEQRGQLATIHRNLRDLFNKEYTSVKIQEIGTTATATLEFDSVKTITDAVNNMAKLMDEKLGIIAENTGNTAMNTAGFRITAGSGGQSKTSSAGATGVGGS